MSNENKENFKMTFNDNLKLIRLRHSPEYHSKFNEFVGNPKKINSLWKAIAKEISPLATYDQIRSKYNSLFSTYKINVKIAEKSGEGKIIWRYYEAFNQTIPSDKKLQMSNVEDLGIIKDFVPKKRRRS